MRSREIQQKACLNDVSKFRLVSPNKMGSRELPGTYQTWHSPFPGRKVACRVLWTESCQPNKVRSNTFSATTAVVRLCFCWHDLSVSMMTLQEDTKE